MSRKAIIAGLVLSALPIAMVVAGMPSQAEIEAKAAAEYNAAQQKARREAELEKVLMSDPKTAAILKKERAKEAAFKSAKRMEAHDQMRAAALVRDSLKNPASFSVVEALEMPGNSPALCLTYRATNSFNAIVTEQIAVTSTGIRSPWDKACAGKRGWDVTPFVRSVV